VTHPCRLLWDLHCPFMLLYMGGVANHGVDGARLIRLSGAAT
jgi:hypothetical protein